mmetsp:Transcript_12473/g.15633  ORF Transcript_12473/g.15633 Transcript_12473/m.15633 type:complete len:428 (+) Transcript_12473:134-1417(+)
MTTGVLPSRQYFPFMSLRSFLLICLLVPNPSKCRSISNNPGNARYSRGSSDGGYPPPPPPPEDGFQGYTPRGDDNQATTPIHYSFPENKQNDVDYDRYDSSTRSRGSDLRGDALIRRYKSTKGGKLLVSLSSTGMGALLALFLTKSMQFLPNKATISAITASFFILSIFPLHLTNPYTTLIQTLGVFGLLLIKEFQDIRMDYPTLPHIKAMLKMAPRQNFQEQGAARWGCLGSMIFVGGFCGGSLPLIPTSIGAVAGAAVMGIGCIRDNAKGDLMRTMGMRLYTLILNSLDISKQLSLGDKLQTFGGKIFDIMLFLDRKHNIKHRLQKIFMYVYDLVMRMVKDVRKNDLQEGGGESREDTRPRRPLGDNDDAGNGRDTYNDRRRRNRDFIDENDGIRRQSKRNDYERGDQYRQRDYYDRKETRQARK